MTAHSAPASVAALAGVSAVARRYGVSVTLVGLAAAVLVLGLSLVGTGTGHAAGEASTDRVLATRIAAEITPVVADQISDGLDRAADGGYAAYVVELDTPGGLDTSMREIVQDTLASEIPVIVYVSPQGARAASAGAVITLASHVAVMAPGTSIGSATPVGIQGEDLEAKVVNDAAAYAESLARLRERDVGFAVAMVREGRSATAEEALRRGVVDGQAASLDGALQVADGKKVTVAGDREVTVSTAGAVVDRYDLGLFRRVLQALANPNLAYLLLTLGTLGLIYELATPGIGVAGIVGAVSLVVALFTLAVLPVNAVGLLLLAVAAALFVAELFAPGVGGFAFGGAVVLVLAALFLFDDAQGVRVDPVVALPTAIVMAVLTILAGRLVLRSQRHPTTASGIGLLVGQVVTIDDVDQDAGGDGTAGPAPTEDDARASRGRVFVDGAWWSVRSGGPSLTPGQRAEVVAVDGLTLVVMPIPPDRPPPGPPTQPPQSSQPPQGRDG